MKVNKEITRAVGAQILSINEEKRYIDFVISNEQEDSYGTVFMSEHWRMDRYRANPVFTYNHYDDSNDPDDTLGTSEIRFEDGQMIARAYFETEEINPKAEKVFRKAQAGTLRGASIRAAVFEARYGNEVDGENPDALIFEDQELRAWSVVTVPSNPTALSRNAEAYEAIRTAAAKDKTVVAQTVSQKPTENKTLSRFEAQLIINENES